MKILPHTTGKLLVFHTECTELRGGEKYIYELIKRIAVKRQTELFVESISPYWLYKYNKLHIPIHQLWKPKYLYWLLLPMTLGINYLRLQTHISKNDTLFAANFPLSFLTTLLSKKTILFCFEPLSVFYDLFRINQSPFRERILLRIIKFCYAPLDFLAVHHAAVIATLNKEVGEAIRALYKRKPDFYIPNGVDTKIFSPKHQPLYPKKHMFTIGHSTDYSPLKGTEVLLRALPYITRVYPNIILYVSESMQNRKIKERYMTLVKRLCIEKHVLFVGSIPENLLPGFYTSCDVFCYTGSTLCVGGSSASLSVLEAEACGVPVLRTRGNSDEIIENRTGKYFPSEEPHIIASTILSYFSLSIKQRELMGDAARKYCVKKFSWSVSSARLLSHI